MSTYEIELREDSIARALASGTPRNKVCALFELTPAALHTLEGRIGGRITSYRERLQLAAQLNQQFVEQLAPKAARNIEALLDDPAHKQHYEVSWKVLERALPAQSVQLGGNVGLAMSEETATALSGVLTALIAHRAAQPPAPTLDEDPNMIDVQ